jgi:hypothetical protein
VEEDKWEVGVWPSKIFLATDRTQVDTDMGKREGVDGKEILTRLTR